MPNSLSPERKGYELRTRFIVAILAHAICDKGSSMHSFANKWLQSDTLATILCCNYRFSSDLLFTGNDIVTAFVQKKEKLHTEFGLDGVHQPFALNLIIAMYISMSIKYKADRIISSISTKKKQQSYP